MKRATGKSPFRKIILFTLSFLSVILNLVLAVIVIMFVSATLHVTGQDVLSPRSLDIILKAVAVIILLLSVLVSVRVYRGVYAILEKSLFRDQSR